MSASDAKKPSTAGSPHIASALRTLATESDGLAALTAAMSDGLGAPFAAAVETIRAARGRVIVAHLGNGASLCAMKDGKSVETTMGLTALDGLPMGTRCGALDAGAVLWMMAHGMDYAAIAQELECSIPALKSLLFRAYETLRRRLAHYAPPSAA